MSQIQVFLIVLSMMPFLPNCSDVKFQKRIPVQVKDEVLDNSDVFPPPVAPESPVLPTPEPAKPSTNLPVNRICSEAMSNKGNPILNATGIKAKITAKDEDGDVVCENNDTEANRKSIVENGTVRFENCGVQPDSETVIEIAVDGPKPTKTALITYPGGPRRKCPTCLGGQFARPKSVSRVFTGARDAKTGELVADNKFEPPFVFVEGVERSKAENPEHCDYFDSPLFVDFRGQQFQPVYMDLTSQIEGVLFDILGRAGNYLKSQISWLAHSQVSSYFMFLAFPAQDGQVHGIDQLFGNNTYGPDGQFASDGFHALTKWDGRSQIGAAAPTKADGYIDRDDAVFHRLRLWADRNINGAADPGELMALDEAGIEYFDLDYDETYYERDSHGNEVRYKSAVKMKNGSVVPMFDLWFKH